MKWDMNKLGGYMYTEYYLGTGHRCTNIYKFRNDREAWERLRKRLPGKFAILFKRKRIATNNRYYYQRLYERKYIPSKYDDYPFMPIMNGITDHKWSFGKKKNVDEIGGM